MIATVVWGANNIYTVRTEDGSTLAHLRIKGKKLSGTEGEANALAPGDLVELTNRGEPPQIESRQPRRNVVRRWNRNRQASQIVAANVDMLAVIASVGTPRYRPNFVDRVLVMAEMEHLSAAIVVNKADRGVTEDAFKHIELLRAIDYPVYAVAARAADAGRFPDFDRLVRRLDTCHVVLIGQSGVGKSTLINRLVPDAGLAVGEVSDKYHRGRHTTTLARQVAVPAAAAELSSSTVLTDTPGVKEFDLGAYSLREIAFGFREFRDPAEHCRIRECTHTHEPDCGVRAAVERNVVSGRRYESYCRILSDIEEHR